MASIEPELWVDRAPAAVSFYETAFGATTLMRVGDGDDIVARLAVGGATGRMLLVVDDPDTVVRRAVDAGARETSPVGVEHGWRLGRVVDPHGHEWENGRPL